MLRDNRIAVTSQRKVPPHRCDCRIRYKHWIKYMYIKVSDRTSKNARPLVDLHDLHSTGHFTKLLGLLDSAPVIL
jgi:hypothetical protein